MYTISPYIRFARTRTGNAVIFNFLLDKLQEIWPHTLKILKYCTTPRTKQDLADRFGEELVDKLIASYQIVSEESVWRETFCNILEIETSTICTWKCEYCPVRTHNRQTQFIDPDLFVTILDKAVEYGHFKQVSLTSYNEASIDGNFPWYLEQIHNHGLKLLLYSNGSCLTEDKLDAVAQMKDMAKICFNLPTLDQKKFESMTGSKTYPRSIAAIDNAIEKGISVTIIVQGDDDTRENECRKIQQRFPQAYAATYAANNRGGSVFNDYITEINITDDRLTGCYMVTRHVCINVHGQLMMCCNDFYHANTYGRIQDGSFRELLTSEQAISMRKATWGGCKAESAHLCRTCTLMLESKTQTSYIPITEINENDIFPAEQ